MKIYSWNVWFGNRKPSAALAFIKSCDFDVFCLQEVPQELLGELKQLPYHIVCGKDYDLRLGRSSSTHDLVILSTFPIVGHQSFHVPIPHAPLRTRLFIHLMRPFSFAHVEGKSGLWADIRVPAGDTLRIMNLHLTLAHPSSRRSELELALQERHAEHPTIVAGDFNILESAHVGILNWILGGSLLDVLFWKRERQKVEAIFAQHGFKNPLRKYTTHPLSWSQLDHILVPREFVVRSVKVFKNSFGSDHLPVALDVKCSTAIGGK